MTRPTTATVYQEVKDFKETYHGDIQDIKKTLNDVATQTRKTNGRVTKLETLQENCPAREAFKTQNKIGKSNNLIAIGSLVVAIAAIVVAILG